MVQLIQMRQQIRAIGSIKKITQAMRLISMSNHTQLSQKAPLIENYKNELSKIINIIEPLGKSNENNFLNPNNNAKTLIILIGSQKGLAGTFNTSLFRFFEEHNHLKNLQDFDFITVGKKATDFLRKHVEPIKSYDNFSISNLYEISDKIFEYLLKMKNSYSNVIVYSNHSRSFFSQIPKKNIILPIKSMDEKNVDSEVDLNSYIWEESATQIHESLIRQYIHFSIQSLLFNSLLAEQASRFQSMDKATTNAEELLADLKIQYNKLRQSRITSEITELSASLR